MTSLLSVFFFFFSVVHLPPYLVPFFYNFDCNKQQYAPGGGQGVTWVNFTGYVQLTSQNPYPIIVYSVANYRSQLSHFLFL